MPEENFRRAFGGALEVALADTMPEWRPRLLTAADAMASLIAPGDDSLASLDDASGGGSALADEADGAAAEVWMEEDRVVLECVDQMDGLEHLIIIAVGLDSVIGQVPPPLAPNTQPNQPLASLALSMLVCYATGRCK